jgi:hypothetical protein
MISGFEMNKVARRLILKDDHPTMVKLNKLADLAEELGISISFYGQSTLINDRDREIGLPELLIEDIESNEPVDVFPPNFEFKVIYDNPIWVEQKRLEYEEYCRTRNEKAAQAKAEKELAEKQAAERVAELQEMRERATLAALKSKYEK